MIQTDRGHFWITFDNGYTISLFNGVGSYSENHFNRKVLGNNEYPIASKDCEIVIVSPSGVFVTNKFIDNDDSVHGYVSVDELVEIINKVKEYKI